MPVGRQADVRSDAVRPASVGKQGVGEESEVSDKADVPSAPPRSATYNLMFRYLKCADGTQYSIKYNKK